MLIMHQDEMNDERQPVCDDTVLHITKVTQQRQVQVIQLLAYRHIHLTINHITT